MTLCEQALGHSGKKKLPFRRKTPLPLPYGGASAVIIWWWWKKGRTKDTITNLEICMVLVSLPKPHHLYLCQKINHFFLVFGCKFFQFRKHFVPMLCLILEIKPYLPNEIRWVYILSSSAFQKLEKPRNGLTQSFLYEDVLGEADKDITGKRGVDP